MKDDLAENLRLLAASRRSVSELCRELGFNRQQFARYLSGEARPSPHNLKRIADGLSVPAADLLSSHEEFSRRYGHRPQGREGLALLDRAFPGDIRRLRPLLGFYHSHFEVPGAPGTLFRSLVCLYEEDGRIHSKSIERRANRDITTGYLSKYRGLASYLGNCIFVVEFECLSDDSVVETILYPPYRKALDVMTGMTFGVTSRVHRQPYASGVIWKYIGATIDMREALARCGRVSLADRKLDPAVRRFFTDGHAARVTSMQPA
ncbi:helix-turn-helix domain-containing protein [Aestuariivirga sp.]|uniref:helix-turn-helix domain-containing protein n=1 Tax=Aestuariivirga sp. TaxID=2650926 RepID=UPI00391B0E24